MHERALYHSLFQRYTTLRALWLRLFSQTFCYRKSHSYKSHNRANEYGLIVEASIFLLFFVMVSGFLYYFLTLRLEQSISSRQATYDIDRGAFHLELPILQLTAGGVPALQPQASVLNVLEKARLYAKHHSLVTLPFCTAVLEVFPAASGYTVQRVANYDIDCSTLSSTIPSCVHTKAEQLYDPQGRQLQYMVMGFYVESGEPYENKCGVARGTAKEVLPPPFAEPTYSLPPTVSLPPSETPSSSPSNSVTPFPSVATSATSIPSVSQSPTVSTTVSVFPSESISEAPNASPSETVVASEMPTESVLISETPVISASEGETLLPSESEQPSESEASTFSTMPTQSVPPVFPPSNAPYVSNSYEPPPVSSFDGNSLG